VSIYVLLPKFSFINQIQYLALGFPATHSMGGSIWEPEIKVCTFNPHFYIFLTLFAQKEKT